MSETGPDLEAPVAEGAVDVEEHLGEEQFAFDVNDFPGGARSAIEAVLMVVDEPVTSMSLASALELPVDDVQGHLEDLEREYAEQQRGFTLRSVAGGGASTAAPTTPPSWRSSSSTASRQS